MTRQVVTVPQWQGGEALEVEATVVGDHLGACFLPACTTFDVVRKLLRKEPGGWRVVILADGIACSPPLGSVYEAICAANALAASGIDWANWKRDPGNVQRTVQALMQGWQYLNDGEKQARARCGAGVNL